MRRRYRPYDPREDGPLHRYKNRRPGYRRAVTMPERVSPHVKLVFAELARQQRTYDELEAASGVRRATVKQWRRKNPPSLDSLEAVLNALGWQFIAVPAHVEMLPLRPQNTQLSRRWNWARSGAQKYRSPRFNLLQPPKGSASLPRSMPSVQQQTTTTPAIAASPSPQTTTLSKPRAPLRVSRIGWSVGADRSFW